MSNIGYLYRFVEFCSLHLKNRDAKTKVLLLVGADRYIKENVIVNKKNKLISQGGEGHLTKWINQKVWVNI